MKTVGVRLLGIRRERTRRRQLKTEDNRVYILELEFLCETKEELCFVAYCLVCIVEAVR